MIRIITDSVSSITQEMAAQLDIQVVTLYVNRNGMEYEDATMDLDAFYADIYDMVDDYPHVKPALPAVAGRGVRGCGPRR